MVLTSAMRRKPYIIALLMVVTLFVVSPTHGAINLPVTVHVTGDFPTNGIISIKVFQSVEDFYRSRPAQTREELAISNAMRITLTNLPPGPCIISILHDRNSDGKMNANAFGMPIESATFVTPVMAATHERITPSRALFNFDGSTNRYDVRMPSPAFEARAWGAGVMGLLASNPYRGGSTVARVLPLISYVGENLYVLGPRAGYNLLKNPLVSANLFAEFKFAGDAFADDRFLADMEERRNTVMSGMDANVRIKGRWRLEANASTDVLNRHNGQEATFSVSPMFRFSQFNLTPGAGVVWRSKNYNDYYYGVREEEATPERPAYEPGDSIEWFLRCSARYTINDDWSILGVIRLEVLSHEIRDSPIIDDSTANTAFVGVNYAF
jgi:outer membrane protein